MKREEWMEAAEPQPVEVGEGDRRFFRNSQRVFRFFTTALENYTFCHLPKCRRARACLGEHAPETYGENYYNRFPPCIRNEAGRQRMIDEMDRYEAQVLAEDPDAEAKITDEQWDAAYAELER
ncbi:hypothetical protein [Rhizobium sp. L1K21]|uniref:hypothetical protein n=1 Tax=Rhizobium sp. L1K21 TaxID=2954933 RepID=UPI00209351E6|nr:hypothetical protein [Rhizobium sp. L1K21]MCO6186304.1 hypothetical protein [Rhizobium sp. L1K21]